METIKTISALSAFERVARLQSFTLAAKELGVSKAYISKLIQSLESELGELLLLRSTRKVRLTVVGEEIYNQCTGPINQIEQLRTNLISKTKTPGGIFRVSVAGVFGEEFIAPVLLDLNKRYPGLKTELLFSNRSVDLIAENFDVAVRVGELSDSNPVSRKIGVRREYICATKGYLDQFGTPRFPEDLKKHNCLIGGSDSWLFKEQKSLKRVRVSGNFHSNNGRVLLKAALAGSGLAKLPDIYVAQHLKSGELVSVLDEYMNMEIPIRVLTHTKAQNSINLQAFWQVLEEKLNL